MISCDFILQFKFFSWFQLVTTFWSRTTGVLVLLDPRTTDPPVQSNRHEYRWVETFQGSALAFPLGV